MLPMAMKMSISRFCFLTSLLYWELTFLTRIRPPPAQPYRYDQILGKDGQEVRLHFESMDQWCLNDFFAGCDSPSISRAAGNPGPGLAIRKSLKHYVT